MILVSNTNASLSFSGTIASRGEIGLFSTGREEAKEKRSEAYGY
jgi:hypothetical protein